MDNLLKFILFLLVLFVLYSIFANNSGSSRGRRRYSHFAETTPETTMTDDAGYARYMDYIQNRLSLDEYPAEEEQEQEQEQEVMGQDFLLEEKLLRGYDKDSGTGELNLIEKEEMYPIQGFNLPLQASPSDDNFAGYVY